MSPELSIKLSYLDKRDNPAEIFEAMGLYIKAYSDFGQIISNSLGSDVDFQFQLNDIEKSSLLSKLSAVPSKVVESIEEIIYNSALGLCDDLVDINKIETEEHVEDLAVKIENKLYKEISDDIAEPYIDRQQLSYFLELLSSANQKVKLGESVALSAGGSRTGLLNTSLRFAGNSKDMFIKKDKNKDVSDKLSVSSIVNKGNSAWGFHSKALGMSFSANIVEEGWLERYQMGLISAIGPMDLIEVKMDYEISRPPIGKGSIQIKNAKITKICGVNRYKGEQYELGA